MGLGDAEAARGAGSDRKHGTGWTRIGGEPWQRTAGVGGHARVGGSGKAQIHGCGSGQRGVLGDVGGVGYVDRELEAFDCVRVGVHHFPDCGARSVGDRDFRNRYVAVSRTVVRSEDGREEPGGAAVGDALSVDEHGVSDISARGVDIARATANRIRGRNRESVDVRSGHENVRAGRNVVEGRLQTGSEIGQTSDLAGVGGWDHKTRLGVVESAGDVLDGTARLTGIGSVGLSENPGFKSVAEVFKKRQGAAEVLVWLEHWPRLVPLLALAERPLLTKATMGVEFRIGNGMAPLTLIDALTGEAPPTNALLQTACCRVSLSIQSTLHLCQILVDRSAFSVYSQCLPG